MKGVGVFNNVFSWFYGPEQYIPFGTICPSSTLAHRDYNTWECQMASLSLIIIIIITSTPPALMTETLLFVEEVTPVLREITVCLRPS